MVKYIIKVDIVSSLKIMKEIADEKKNTDTYNWIGV
jgi:hypothetical protein